MNCNFYSAKKIKILLFIKLICYNNFDNFFITFLTKKWVKKQDKLLKQLIEKLSNADY